MKKVLIITYYFPPAGGPGVQRWLKFIKYLPDFDIQPIVYVPQNPTYPIVDAELEKEVPDSTIILRKSIFEPYKLASIFSKAKTKTISSGIIPSQRRQTPTEKMLLWIRGNLFIPDARIFWVSPSVKFLKKYIRDHDIDTIVTSGPPHSMHLIGCELRHKLNIKWIADFRDPWTTIGYHKALNLSRSAEKEHKKLEREVLNTADQVIVTSKNTKLEFSKITSKPIEVITNGYDNSDVAVSSLDTKFSLAHIGSFLSGRNPMILWQSLSELIKEVPDFATYFELKLIGTISSEILEMIHAYNLNDYLNLIGYVSHEEAIRHQKKAQVLLLVEINSFETISIIPGKLFEYMVSGRPIIAIGPRGSDFAEIITETNTGVFFDYEEKDKLKETILRYFAEFKEGKLKSNPVGLQQYSRKSLTGKLAELIRKLQIPNA
jgi:glycosyltransferase involved in cell wall biosynthesis